MSLQPRGSALDRDRLTGPARAGSRAIGTLVVRSHPAAHVLEAVVFEDLSAELWMALDDRELLIGELRGLLRMLSGTPTLPMS